MNLRIMLAGVIEQQLPEAHAAFRQILIRLTALAGRVPELHYSRMPIYGN